MRHSSSIPEGYRLWDGQAGDIVPEGALHWWGFANGWNPALTVGERCEAQDVYCYAVPVGYNSDEEPEYDSDEPEASDPGSDVVLSDSLDCSVSERLRQERDEGLPVSISFEECSTWAADFAELCCATTRAAKGLRLGKSKAGESSSMQAESLI